MLQSEIEMEEGSHPVPALGKKRQLLVVDDNKAVREALSKMFVSLGHSVTSASNGFDGGLLFCTRDYDLVIIDLKAPKMNVWELSRILKERSPKTPVIMVTGVREDKHQDNSERNRADAMIPKPFKLKKISDIVQMLLKSGT